MKVGHGTRSFMDRWREAGSASLRWGSGTAVPEGRTFQEDMVLLESEMLAEHFDRGSGLHVSDLENRTIALRIRTS